MVSKQSRLHPDVLLMVDDNLLLAMQTSADAVVSNEAWFVSDGHP